MTGPPGPADPTAALDLVVPTPRGTAALRVALPRGEPVALAALGHGAGGGVEAPDLVAVTAALRDAGVAVGLVTQPYRVAGRKVPAPAAALDEAWLAAVEALRGHLGAPALPLVAGGRSSGARVACRTAARTGAVGILALAFPLVPPARGGRPDRPPVSRARELEAALRTAPVLVVQGTADPFGGPDDIAAAVPAVEALTVHAVDGGDHALRAGRPRLVPDGVARAVAAAVHTWTGAPGIGPGRPGVGGGARGRHPED